MIDEKKAWRILDSYLRDLLQIDSASLLAVYAIGSLAGGYYRPGQSDIDAILIVKNRVGHIWGDSEQPSTPLRELNRRYLEKCRIPKDFGPCAIRERDLFPPYDPAKGLVEEIARLKLQGRCIYGEFDLQVVPMPSAEDFLRDAQRFEVWWRDKFSKENPLEGLSPAACVNTILMHLGRFLRIKRGVFEFDKRRLVTRYLGSAPPFADEKLLHTIQSFLDRGRLSQHELKELRRYVSTMREGMNAFLGIET